jgi:hypothetical protein
MTPRHGVPVWFWVAVAVAQTVTATMLWRSWLEWKDLAVSYPPEVLAAVHFRIPSGLFRSALAGTVVAILLWAIAIRRAEP